MNRRIAHAAQIGALVLALALVPAALAAKSNGGAGSCTASAPAVWVENTWAWGATGAWGQPGQQLSYEIGIANYDSGCSSSSFVINLTAPNGFSVSIPTNSITLSSGAIGYLWAYVTSPGAVADGNYPLTITATRASSPTDTASSTSYYKVYSSDTVAPTVYWPNPDNGAAISGRSLGVVVSSADDHAVKKIDLYLDGAYTSTTNCADVSSVCQLYYKWAIRGVHGTHTATFKSYDWMGNVGVLTTTFSVN
jgi:hypothetical protein